MTRVIADLRRSPGPLMLALAGNVFIGDQPPAGADQRAQADLEAEALVAVLRRLRPDVVVPGPLDLQRGQPYLRDLLRGTRASVLATAALSFEGADASGAGAIKQIGPHRVGLVHSGANAVDRVAQLRRAGAHLVVMFGHALAEEAVAAARATAGADLLVLSGAEHAGVSTAHGALVVHGGKHGEELVLARVRPADPSRPAPPDGAHEGAERPLIEVEVRPLDARVRPDPEVRRLLDQVFARINARHAGAGHPAPATPTAGARTAYVGARTCAACHTQAYFWWLRTGHARAYRTLQARGRQLDLDCIRCHVTGFGEPGGAALGRLDELTGVGCESCHGPGSLHADNPHARASGVHREAPAPLCVRCHDPQHSDDFVYASKRSALLAPGHGQQGAPKRRSEP